ncbi:hypothetical protein EV361DRAFT_871391 [Lentinula raphanica]|uniref:Uncharacterized protein n=1 Tax=Lentinula raphanica TaxID=153919 RepID=A0AA38NX53_9AGAR|nr:hypothetical protein F5878DRAFT_646924 [Lentinula raphanica]KAJ3967748.1 hypothetical protein EV361DRAFT_871391 [Lentinula raphanica]
MYCYCITIFEQNPALFLIIVSGMWFFVSMEVAGIPEASSVKEEKEEVNDEASISVLEPTCTITEENYEIMINIIHNSNKESRLDASETSGSDNEVSNKPGQEDLKLRTGMDQSWLDKGIFQEFT